MAYQLITENLQYLTEDQLRKIASLAEHKSAEMMSERLCSLLTHEEEGVKCLTAKQGVDSMLLPYWTKRMTEEKYTLLGFAVRIGEPENTRTVHVEIHLTETRSGEEGENLDLTTDLRVVDGEEKIIATFSQPWLFTPSNVDPDYERNTQGTYQEAVNTEYMEGFDETFGFYVEPIKRCMWIISHYRNALELG